MKLSSEQSSHLTEKYGDINSFNHNQESLSPTLSRVCYQDVGGSSFLENDWSTWMVWIFFFCDLVVLSLPLHTWSSVSCPLTCTLFTLSPKTKLQQLYIQCTHFDDTWVYTQYGQRPTIDWDSDHLHLDVCVSALRSGTIGKNFVMWDTVKTAKFTGYRNSRLCFDLWISETWAITVEQFQLTFFHLFHHHCSQRFLAQPVKHANIRDTVFHTFCFVSSCLCKYRPAYFLLTLSARCWMSSLFFEPGTQHLDNLDN